MISKVEFNKDYIKRINLALKYIDAHLDAKLTLNTIAEVSYYSPYHFHRIFKAIIGETLNDYIIRQRVEKAAIQLITKKDITVAELAERYGFNSHAVFTRTFKKYYNVSPTEFKTLSPSRYSKINQTNRKKSQGNFIFEEYICNINNHLNWITMNATIEIKTIETLTCASITHIGVEGLEHIFDKLIRWGTSNDLMANPNTKLARVFHDSFKVTAPDKVRMSISLLTNEPFTAKGEITKTEIAKGKYIVGRFEILPNEFETSWSSLFIWMNDKGYEKADKNPFEIYHNDYREHPERKFIVDFYIPIK